MRTLIFLLSVTLFVMLTAPSFFAEDLGYVTSYTQSASLIPNVERKKTEPKKDADLLSETQNVLPRISNTSFDRRDVHHTPSEIFRPAEQFTEMEKALQEHPEKAESYLSLYSSCARDEDVFAAVRAFCLSRYLHWKEKLDFVDESNPFFSDEIRDLAAKLPDL